MLDSHGGFCAPDPRLRPNSICDMDLTVAQFVRTMNVMNAIENLIPHEIMAELQEATKQAAKGLRDPDAARKACERMDRMREKNRQRLGAQDVGVEIIREMRDTR